MSEHIAGSRERTAEAIAMDAYEDVCGDGSYIVTKREVHGVEEFDEAVAAAKRDDCIAAQRYATNPRTARDVRGNVLQDESRAIV